LTLAEAGLLTISPTLDPLQNADQNSSQRQNWKSSAPKRQYFSDCHKQFGTNMNMSASY